MNKAFYRFYEKQEWTYRTVQIENNLYTKLKHISEEELDTSISKLVDACVENFEIKGNKIVYYKKSENEITIKASIRLRQVMWDKLEKMRIKYDVSIQKLVNMAIKYTLDSE